MSGSSPAMRGATGSERPSLQPASAVSHRLAADDRVSGGSLQASRVAAQSVGRERGGCRGPFDEPSTKDQNSRSNVSQRLCLRPGGKPESRARTVPTTCDTAKVRSADAAALSGRGGLASGDRGRRPCRYTQTASATKLAQDVAPQSNVNDNDRPRVSAIVATALETKAANSSGASSALTRLMTTTSRMSRGPRAALLIRRFVWRRHRQDQLNRSDLASATNAACRPRLRNGRA